ncbi:MAG: class D beta-lactamase [Candidatus Melainabacteria bacterium]|nr:class D beta-lactamase [Candidatus Melainabacteria bacterium]
MNLSLTNKRVVLSIVSLLVALVFTCSAAYAAALKKDVDLEPLFQGYDGAFVLLDLNTNKFVRYNKTRCAKRFAPCSTFKIFNALAGLDSKVISGPDDKKKWDGKKRMVDSWNRDHTLETAMQESTIWYFQEVAKDVGEERMKKYIQAVGYGNQDISGGITKFWLGGSLAISADEQVAFLKRLYNNDLPFSKEAMETVKKILIVSDDGSSIMRGKTGTDMVDGKTVLGWFVGYVIEDGKPYIFATNISADDKVNGRLARTITRSILHNLGLH